MIATIAIVKRPTVKRLDGEPHVVISNPVDPIAWAAVQNQVAPNSASVSMGIAPGGCEHAFATAITRDRPTKSNVSSGRERGQSTVADFVYQPSRKTSEPHAAFTKRKAVRVNLSDHSHSRDRALDMMQPAIGPFSKPASFNNVLRQVFAVTQDETPRDIATLLARLAAAESTTASRESLSGGLDDGALMRRLRRLRYF